MPSIRRRRSGILPIQGASARQHHSVLDLQKRKERLHRVHGRLPGRRYRGRGRRHRDPRLLSQVWSVRRCLSDRGDHFAAPGAQNLYDDIVSAATSHETAYVTCTRALKRMPRENEVVVACVGDITAETWFSVLADYPNVSVYLPLGVCDKCRNTGGEDILARPLLPPRSGRVRAWAWRSTPRASNAMNAPRVRAQGVHG